MTTENYIYTYYQQITDGSIVVNEYVKSVYEYVVRGLENKSFFYNAKKAKAAVVFIENFCRHSEGKLAGQKIKLELWQRAMLSVVFGIVDAQGYRQFREVLCVVARKNGKSLLAAAVSAYMAYADGERGARIYYAAPKLEQASICFNGFQQIVFTEPLLEKITQKRRSDVYIPSTNTSAKPLAFSAKKSDGLNVSLCIADEIASWQGDAGLKFYEVIKSSFGARTQPLLFAITTAGYINDGIYDELIKRATRVLKGNSKETRFIPFIYAVDDPTKWDDINELQKSNPNLNVSVPVDYLLSEIAVADGSLSKKAEFLTKYCNVKQNSSTAWLRTQDVNAAYQDDELRLEDFRNCYCVCGIDLSKTTDLTSCCAVIEKEGKLYVFSKFYLPAEKLEEAIQRDGVPYDIYVKRGLLTLSGDNFIDYRDCFAWLCSLVEKYKIYPLQVGYDRYCATYLVSDLKAYGFHTDDVYQGENLTPVIKEFDGLLRDHRFNIGNNDILKMHLLDSALKINNESDRVKLIKVDRKVHIDGTAALLDAMCVRQKWWSELGPQLINARKT